MDAQLVSSIEQIIRDAGALVLSHLGSAYQFERKADRTMVTEVDKASERYLLAHLLPLLAGSEYLAEESGSSNGLQCAGKYCWVIDPIDGTTNFMHHNPYFCISVALMHGDEIVFGAVYAPYRNEYFHAVHGQGAFFNHKSMTVVNRDIDAMPMTVALGGPSSSPAREQYLAKMHVVQKQIKSIRKNGSAALDLAYVANGWLDAAFLGKLSWWDVAAGVLLVREAGGRVTDLGADTIASDYNFCLAGHQAIHAHLQQMLA